MFFLNAWVFPPWYLAYVAKALYNKLHSSWMRYRPRVDGLSEHWFCTGEGAGPGVSAPRGVQEWSGGQYPNACTEADPPPVNRITHACENITLPQIRCGR